MKRWMIAVAVCLSLGSCAGGEELAALASEDLNGRVVAIRAAVEQGNPERAQVLVERLQGEVARLVAQGVLTEARATTIESLAEDVLAQLALLSTGAPASESPSPTPGPEPGEDDEEGEGHDNSGPGNGGDHGHSGHGGGSGED